jgi:hypothetical protein
VLVFIYGGSYRTGSNAFPLYGKDFTFFDIHVSFGNKTTDPIDLFFCMAWI